jgi:hypothetical protein
MGKKKRRSGKASPRYIYPDVCCVNCRKHRVSCVVGSKDCMLCINHGYRDFVGKWNCKYER